MYSTVIESTVVGDTTVEIRYNEIPVVHLYELWVGDRCEYSNAQYTPVLHEYNIAAA